MQTYRYAIIGGGVVAGYAAQELAHLGLQPGELCLLSAEAVLPYERAALSQQYLQRDADETAISINSAEFYADHGIAVHLGTQVETVDLSRRRLRTISGMEIGFDKLLIATGSRPRILDLPGANQAGMYYLHTLADAQTIRALADTTRRAVVVGGGYIALEAAASLRRDGLAVTLLVPGAELLQDRFDDPQIARFFAQRLENEGVQVVKNASVTSFSANGQVSGVILDHGQTFPADFVVVEVGVQPATDLFVDSGLELDDGVVTNEYLEASVNNVLAAGDVARYYDLLFDRQRRVEQQADAIAQARHAARVLTNRREPFVHVPYFSSQIADTTWEFWGDSQGATHTIQRGSLEDASFSQWWLHNQRLIAALIINRPDEERDMAPEWIRSQEAVPRDLLERQDLSLRAPYPDEGRSRQRR